MICRVHGYETRLLKPEKLQELMSSSALNQFIEGLSGTAYEHYISGSKTLDEIERGLAEALVDRLAALLSLAEGGARSFLKAYLGKYETINLTWILRMKIGESTGEELEMILLPTEKLGGIELKPLLEARDLQALRDAIQRSGMYELSKDADDPLQLEADLWRSHYRRVFKLASRIRISDSREVRGFLGLEVDLANLKTCMLALLRGWDPEKVKQLLIFNPAGIPLKKLQEAVEERDPKVLVERFRRFKGFLEKALASDEWALEFEGLRIMKRYADSQRISKFISFFYILKYILELEVEYRNLRATAVAIHHNLPQSLRRSLLITD
ncbi:MAG: V-type ATPase subunit [Nitrososphaerota archaeon]